MAAQRKGFWRGFTWKRFGWNTFFLFLLGIGFAFLDNYTDRGLKTAYISFTDICKTALIAGFFGLIAAIWHEPPIDDKKPFQPGKS